MTISMGGYGGDEYGVLDVAFSAGVCAHDEVGALARVDGRVNKGQQFLLPYLDEFTDFSDVLGDFTRVDVSRLRNLRYFNAIE